MTGFYAEWPAPTSVRTFISTREGGASQPPFDSNNLAFHVGDNSRQVQVNRQRLLREAGSRAAIQWLQQVHGTEVVEADSGDQVPQADGCVTTTPGLACAVLTADCLPVLLCDRQGAQVAAVHAGWRGLAAGVLSSALRHFAAGPADVLAYLGPAISQRHFEVGAEVLEYFRTQAQGLGAWYVAEVDKAFVASTRPEHYRADLYHLARSQCTALGIEQVYGGNFCTYEERSRFYSYRRDGQTGRMASLIWLEDAR